MEVHSIESVIRALNDAGVRYLIAGGLAVIAHGYTRSTQDMDLILDLGEENLSRAMAALAGLQYRPTVPVAMEMFADPLMRRQWIVEKGMLVFNLFSPAHETVEIDLFVEEPIDFRQAYALAFRDEVVPGVPATFVSLEDLLLLKRQAGRPRDLIDIEKLETVHGKPPGG
jgi:predicted nucleotidyltransferase